MRSPLRILVVDDEPIVRTVLQMALSRSGYLVRGASSFSEVETVCTEFEPQVALVDLILSGPAASGLDVADYLQHHNPGIQIIFMTGLPPDYRCDLKAISSRPVLEKPTTLNEVREAVRAAVDARASADRSCSAATFADLKQQCGEPLAL